MNAHAFPLETRSEQQQDADPIVAATTAVEELRTAATAFETRQAAELKATTDRIAALETRLNRPNAQATEKRDERTDEQRAFGTYLRHGAAGLNDVERRALTVANDASAGFLAPEILSTEIIKGITEKSPIRQHAKIITIAGPEIRYPKRLTGTNAAWADEVENRPESTLTYTQVAIAPGELATFVEASKVLIEDAAVDLEAEIREALSEDFAVKENTAYVVGDGVKKPRGLLAAGTGIPEVNSGAAATLGAAPLDTLIGLYTSLPTQYAQNASWVLNRQTLATLRKIKDTSGQYIWQPSVQIGAPATLLGRPVVEAVDMPNVGAGAFPILFGDLSGYRIVERVGLQVLVDPFTRATNGITRFHARRRVGGDVIEPAKMVKLKVAA